MIIEFCILWNDKLFRKRFHDCYKYTVDLKRQTRFSTSCIMINYVVQ